MTKEEKKCKQQWERHCAEVILRTLLHEESHNTCDSGKEAAHGGDDSNNEVSALPVGKLSETTFMLKDHSLGCYLIAIWQLLKQALFHKDGEHFILVGYQSPVTSAE